MNNNEFDKIFKDNLENMDGMPPGLSFDLDRSFDRIQQELHKDQRSAFTVFMGSAAAKWYGMAASVALLIGSTYITSQVLKESDIAVNHTESSFELVSNSIADQMGRWTEDIFMGSPKIITPILPEEEETTAGVSKQRSLLVLSEVNIKSRRKSQLEIANERINLSLDKVAKQGIGQTAAPIASINPTPTLSTAQNSNNLGTEFNVGGGVTAKAPALNGSLAAVLRFGTPSEKLSKLKVGAELNQLIKEASQDINKTLMLPYVYAKAEFGQYSNYSPKAKGWNIGAGILMNPDGQQLIGNTFKVYAGKKTKWGLTISPELIITNDGQNFIPGISVSI